MEQGGVRFAGQESGYIYSRLGNPTVTTLEEKVAQLEGGEDALATASGMGAISTAIWSSVEAGDEIVADETLYGCTFALLSHGITKFGVKVRLVDMTGAVMSPFNAFLMARGMKTLDIRMERHCANAQKVAEFLESHPTVEKVYYPGLKSFEGYEIAKRQMKLPGGMISMELKAGREATAAALNKLQLCTIAVSLGGAETLVEHAASMTHSTYTAEELKEANISEGLVRISVGLEDPEDIIADFKAVLDTLL